HGRAERDRPPPSGVGRGGSARPAGRARPRCGTGRGEGARAGRSWRGPGHLLVAVRTAGRGAPRARRLRGPAVGRPVSGRSTAALPSAPRYGTASVAELLPDALAALTGGRPRLLPLPPGVRHVVLLVI